MKQQTITVKLSELTPYRDKDGNFAATNFDRACEEFIIYLHRTNQVPTDIIKSFPEGYLICIVTYFDRKTYDQMERRAQLSTIGS